MHKSQNITYNNIKPVGSCAQHRYSNFLIFLLPPRLHTHWILIAYVSRKIPDSATFDQIINYQNCSLIARTDGCHRHNDSAVRSVKGVRVRGQLVRLPLLCEELERCRLLVSSTCQQPLPPAFAPLHLRPARSSDSPAATPDKPHLITPKLGTALVAT